MGGMRFVLFLGCFLFAFLTKADEMYSPDIMGLYNASLIVTGTPQIENGQVTFRIHNVLKNTSGASYNSKSTVVFSPTRYGQLSVLNPNPITDTLIVYLKKYQGKWYTYGGSQQIHTVKKGKIPFEFCQVGYELTPGEYLRMKKQFFTTFRWLDERKFTPLVTQEVFEKYANPSPVVRSMYTCPNWNSPAIYEPEIAEPEEPRETEQNKIYQFVEKEAEYPGGPQAMWHYLEMKWNAQVLNDVEQEVEGRVFVSMVIEKDGSLTQVEILRGVFPSIDEKVVQIITEMPAWTPAEQNGQPVRSVMRIPVRIP